MKLSKKWVISTLSLLLLILLWIGSIHNVDTNLNKEDIEVFEKIYDQKANTSNGLSYEAQIEQILVVFNTAINVAPVFDQIPFGQQREPLDLVRQGRGLCHDRSRFIEKSLAYLGYEVRHLAIYESVESSTIKSLLKPGIASHSVTEVKTKNGWMYVDPNSGWISITSDNTPIAVKDLSEKGMDHFDWKYQKTPALMRKDFVYVYGLYSRHGKFYEPYNAIPDLNFWHFLLNFWF